MGFSLSGFLKKSVDQVNPFDNGKSFQNQNVPPPPATTRQVQSPIQHAMGNVSHAIGNTVNAGARIGTGVVDQVNQFDGGRTFKQTTPQNYRSVFQQTIHNGATNVAGMVAKPLLRTGQAVTQGIGNAELALAGRPTKNADDYFGTLNKATDYTGTKRQIAGDAAQTALTVATPGVGKVVEKSFAAVAPKVVPKLLTKTVANAGTGAIVGAPFNAAAYLGGNQPVTAQGLKDSAVQGAQFGAALGIATPLLGAAGKVAAPVVAQGVRQATPIVAQAARNAGAATTKLVQNVNEKALSTPEVRANLADQAALRDYSDYLSGAYNPGTNINAVIAAGQAAAEKHGIQGVRTADVATRMDAINGVLDNLGKQRTATMQGGKALISEDGSVIPTIKKATTKLVSQESSAVPYATQVQRLLAERQKAMASGQSEYAYVAEQKLKSLGYDPAKVVPDRQANLVVEPLPKTPKQVAPVQPLEKPGESVALAKSTPEQQPITKLSIPEDAPVSGEATRGFGATINKDAATGADIKKAVSDLSYNVRNTKDLQTRAATLIRENPELAVKVAQTDQTDIGVMLGNQLIPHLSRIGQSDLAIQIAKDTAAKLTKAGQTAQAAAAYGKLAPEGVLRFAQSVVNEYNKMAELKPGKELVLTPEKADSILKKSQALQEMPEGRAKDIATAEMLQEIKQIPPSSWVAKLSSLHTIGQLFNPKTLIRNIGGNTMFGGLENASQVVATGVDKGITGVRKLAGNKEAERTVTLPNLKTQAIGYVKGGKQQFEETNKGINLGPDTQFDLNQVPTFRRGALAKVEKGLGYALRVPDKAAFQAAYDDTVKGLMKANKLDKPTQSILEQANATALYRTFQNDSSAAKLFSGLKRSLNYVGVEGKDGKTFGLGDLILKYPKTPGNILSAGIDYSPAGLVKGISQVAINAAKGRPFDQAALATSIGRSTVGTGALVGTGAALGALGIITEKPSADVDTRNLQKASGLGGYQINTSALKRFVTSGFSKDAAKLQEGDTLVSYDWAQPASIPLSAGAALGKKQSPKDGAISSLTGLADGLNTLVEQPLVTGVSTLAGNIKNKGLVGAGTETLKGAPASFVPTMSNQARQLTDNTTRSSYDPVGLKQSFNMAINKIPGLDKVLLPQVDSFGNDKKNYQNNSNNLFNVAINPAFVSKYQPSDNANLPLDILKNTGETKQVPQTPKTTQTVDGKSMKLTAAQNEQYSRFVGTKANELFSNLSKDKDFLSLSQSDQATRISSSLSDINEAAKIKILGGSTEKVGDNAQSILDGGAQTYSTLPVGTKSTKAYYKTPDAEYKALQKTYDDNLKKGFNSPAAQIKAKNELDKSKAGATFTKDIRDAYELTNDDLYDYVSNDKNGKKIAEDVIAYGDKLVAAGIIKKNKFKDKYGNVTLTSAASKVAASNAKGRKASNSKFASALKSSNAAANSNQGALIKLVRGARVSSRSSRGKNLQVANVTLKKQTAKKQKVRA